MKTSSLGFRVSIAVLVGLMIGCLVYAAHIGDPIVGDFWRPWVTAQSIIRRSSPYTVFGPGGQFPHEFPNLYPATVGVIVLPFLALRFWVAAAIFSAISTGLLAFGLSKEGYQRFPLFVALPFLIAAYSQQWSVIFSAAFLLPTLSFLYVAKPSIGLGMLVANSSRRAIVSATLGGVLILVISLLAIPSWPSEWIATISHYSRHMVSPIRMPGGIVALLALFKWRRPEARLIVAMALVPQNIAWYDSVPLLLVPSTMIQSLIMAMLSSTPATIEVLTHGGADKIIDLYPRGYDLALYVYLPAVLMVLMRPNVPTEATTTSARADFHLHSGDEGSRIQPADKQIPL